MANNNEQKAEKLISMGGTRWQKGDHDRVYLNNAAYTLIGLTYETYKTGNIKSATLNGESISNSKASKLQLGMSRSYYDVKIGSYSGINTDRFLEEYEDLK